jgi:hypothetical protein
MVGAAASGEAWRTLGGSCQRRWIERWWGGVLVAKKSGVVVAVFWSVEMVGAVRRVWWERCRARRASGS